MSPDPPSGSRLRRSHNSIRAYITKNARYAPVRTQVVPSFSPFGHPTQVDKLIGSEIRTFCDLRELASRLANPFGRPSQVRTQVQVLETCVDCIELRVLLARA